KNKLNIAGKSLKSDTEYYVLPYSALHSTASGKSIKIGSGLLSKELGRNDYEGFTDLKGKIAVMDYATPEADNPHSKWAEASDLRKRIEIAVSKGISGLIIYNSNDSIKNPEKNSEIKITPFVIPIVFVKSIDAARLKNDQQITIETDIEKIMHSGHNVIGYIDNHAENTVVIGAHYDHLGYGGHESLYRGTPAIHNGADDNASGTSTLIELARKLKSSSFKKYNYLFIAFSGEEKGLLGSNYYVKHPTIDLKKVNYMLNMDMVGRLKPEEHILLINGAGTSPSWDSLLNNIKVDSLRIKTTASGVGPSDHTSFYLEGIPVLHFFSGTHSDYHKPSDDEPLINYNGMVSIFHYMYDLIEQTNKLPKLTFTKTNDSSNEDAPRFKVTLGVVPDYAFEGSGMRIDGVTEGRPAAIAGFLKGDVVIQMGEEKVADMMSYMKALSKFKKGDKVKVKVQRGNEVVEKDVTF
ncbi:MAG TPA: M28 family peptidase, partial [Bacteroidia bacterium]|nr:M28 family peptidase [Bacteroidia bacterium]